MNTQLNNHTNVSIRYTENTSVSLYLDGKVTFSALYGATFESVDHVRTILDKLESDMVTYKRKHNF